MTALDPDLSDEQIELADVLNTALDKGVILHGDVTLAVADVDLIKLNLGLLLAALETVDRPRLSGEQPEGGASAVARQTLADALGAPTFGCRHSGNEEVPSPTAPPLNAVARGLPERINADPTRVESGLARLVLTLIEVLRKVLEHQAVRRMDGGKLSAADVERLGLALSKLNDRMGELKQVFGLSDDDLQIDLGPLGHLR